MLHFCQKLKLLCYTLNPMIIQKVALAVFKDKKMLQVRTKKQDKVFYTLGGKIEKEETEEQGVSIKEEEKKQDKKIKPIKKEKK